MRTKQEETYECSLFIGSVEGYHGDPFTEDDLVTEIGVYQKLCGGLGWTPVRVTPTRFVSQEYNERGWQVTAICYPRKPHPPYIIWEFMNGLAEYLLHRFRQNRISVMDSKLTVMHEAENPEEKA